METPDQLTENQAAFLRYVLQENDAAIDFCELVWGISQIIDDLVDVDKPVDSEDIRRAFWDAIIALPNNSFYQQHFLTLNPLLQGAFLDWAVSDDLRAEGGELAKAGYVLRDQATRIVVHCARIIGGYDWARQIDMKVCRALYVEPMQDYAGESA